MSDELEPPDEALAELGALYRRLQPPRTPDELAEADAETVRAVEWVRAAYRGLAVPPRALSRPLLREAPRPLRRLPRVLVLVSAAAAAVVALVLGAAALLRLARPSASTEPGRVAQAPAPVADDGVEILAVLPDRLELRAGPVRLVLLDPSPPPSTPPGS